MQDWTTSAFCQAPLPEAEQLPQSHAGGWWIVDSDPVTVLSATVWGLHGDEWHRKKTCETLGRTRSKKTLRRAKPAGVRC